ncbi:MAG TPA: DNA-processing protein DprA [Trebonia sp.]|nr:DNA-processing protein DprA [Trebonia sp.]
MTGGLTDENYARASLTYLAEPADRRLTRLLREHGAARTLDAIKSGSPLGPGSPGQGASMDRWRVRLPELPRPEQLLAFRESGIRLVCPGDPEWPGQLADLGDDEPYALWLRGSADLRFSCLRSVAIVGARAATAYGSYVAAEFAASVAARGWAVISGGAFGVDAAAHRGALSADGVTIAVLACGVDVPYPSAHADLLDATAAQGVLVSEWPPGRQVSRLRFLVRNRVIAALATGTLVVEASQRSGAINTARHARDLHRRLMAVPGPITSDLSAGCHHIVREWQGVLVTSAAEVTENLSPVGATVPAQLGVTLLPRDALGHDQATVLDAMPRRGGSGTVRVAQRAGMDPATVVRCLGELSAAGFIERCDDGWRLRRTATAR